MSARRFNYFDDYQGLILECPTCDWEGTFEQGSVETYDDLMDCACPACDVFEAPILAEVLYPTLEELRANSDRPGVREWVGRIDQGFDEFEAQKLRDATQLPTISDTSFVLVWDFEEDKTADSRRTLIRYKDETIFSEPARYQEFQRFGEVAEILEDKYGDRIKDLVPTRRSEPWLYGDPRKGEAFVEWIRVQTFGATVVKREEPDSHSQRVMESILALAPDEDLASTEAEPAFQLNSTKLNQQQSGPVVTAKARRAGRPVPGVPGIAWRHVEGGTTLVIDEDSNFYSLPDSVRTDILGRLTRCCEAPQHYLRVSAMRDEFSTDPEKVHERVRAEAKRQQSNGRPCAQADFEYGPELPDIDALEFGFVFDYSDDHSKYFVLYGKTVILSGPSANDSGDITDRPLGNQFIEIAKRLKTEYGARLLDLVPTKTAAESLTDIWGWALKREYGRRIVKHGLGVSQF